MRQVYYAKPTNQQSPTFFFSPYLTFLEGEIELQRESDYGITNLERRNGLLMLMRNSVLVPQPTGRESILFARIRCK